MCGAIIDTWPKDGNIGGATMATKDSISATMYTDETDTVPLDRVKAMIQNDISENGDGGDSDAGGDE